jgi:hypothetical protein
MYGMFHNSVYCIELFIPCQPRVFIFFKIFCRFDYFFRRTQLGSLQTVILFVSQCGQSFTIIHVLKNIGFSFLPGLSLLEQCVLIIAASLATIYNALR